MGKEEETEGSAWEGMRRQRGALEGRGEEGGGDREEGQRRRKMGEIWGGIRDGGEGGGERSS